MEILKFTPASELAKQLKEVPILTKPNIKPYENARVVYDELSFRDFRPSQLYVLRENIERQIRLNERIKQLGHNTLQLAGGIIMEADNQQYAMIPPVVEYNHEDGLVLLDGTHRAVVARELGYDRLGVMRVESIKPELIMPHYANNWSDIKLFDIMPEDKDLKHRYRFSGAEKKDHYRSFDIPELHTVNN